MSGAHSPQPPTTHKWHPIIFYYRSILLHPDIVREAHLYPLLPFCSPFSVSLLYSFKRENITFLGSPEMSDKSIYEWWLYLHPLHTYIAFLVTLFSLLNNNSREKTIHTPLYPFPGGPEMSDKLRYEWQIILRYYPHIIHDVSLERPTTSPYKTIHLERQTAPHLLSHRTTHLQYWWKDYAYSLTQ